MVVARVTVGYLFFILALAACGGSTPPASAPGGGVPEVTARGAFAEDEAPPSYDKAELERALASEKSALEAGEKRVADAADDSAGLQVALADLAVRRRFVASLEDCRASGRHCPPRLDEPAWSYDVEGSAAPRLDTALRFDLDDWRKVAGELHGRACACRTLQCVDSLGVAIDALEKRPMADVQDDEAASTSITRARECLLRLRGRVH